LVVFGVFVMIAWEGVWSKCRWALDPWFWGCWRFWGYLGFEKAPKCKNGVFGVGSAPFI